MGAGELELACAQSFFIGAAAAALDFILIY
jgi:hypothetical protein